VAKPKEDKKLTQIQKPEKEDKINDDQELPSFKPGKKSKAKKNAAVKAKKSEKIE